MGEDWVPFCKRDKLPLPLLLGICAATLAGSLLWTIVFALFYPLAARVEMSSTLSTVLLLMGSVIGFFVQPIVGAVGDNCTFKWGRRRILNWKNESVIKYHPSIEGGNSNSCAIEG